jgi:ferric-dicitrate binding protein FerR (iron transport regulator)
LRGLDETLDGHLREFEQLRNQATAHRERLVKTVDHSNAEGAPLTEQLTVLMDRAEQLDRRRASARLLGWVFLVIAVVLWGAWGVLMFPRVAPPPRR